MRRWPSFCWTVVLLLFIQPSLGEQEASKETEKKNNKKRKASKDWSKIDFDKACSTHLLCPDGAHLRPATCIFLPDRGRVEGRRLRG